MKTRLPRPILLILIAVLSIGFVSCTLDPEKKKKEHVERGNKFASSGKYKEASIMYKLAIKIDQRYGEAYYRLGLADLKTGRYADALASLRRASELQPDNLDAHAKLADLYWAFYLSNPDKSKQRWIPELQEVDTKILKKDPKSFDGLRIKGYLAAADEKLKDAIDNFRAADAVKPMQPDLILDLSKVLARDGQLAEAEKLLTQLIAKEKSDGRAYDLLYVLMVRAGRMDDAEKVLQSKVSNNPSNSQYLLQLAGHYYNFKKTPEMKSTLLKLTSNPKEFPNALLEVGDFYFRIGELENAAQEYTKGMNSDAKQKAVYQKRLVDTLSNQGRNAEALNLVEQVLKDNDKDPEAIARRASLWLQSGRKDQLQLAINDLQSVLSKMPDNVVLRFNLGRALLAKGDVDAAKLQFQDAIKLRTDYLPPRLALAQIQLQKGETGAALQAANEILAIQPNNLAAKLFRTTAMLAMREFPKAKAELDEILKVNPDSRDAKFQLAMVYLNQRDFKKAEDIYRQLMGLNPPDPRGIMGLTETYMAAMQYDSAVKLIKEQLAKSPDRLDYHVALGNIYARSGKYDDAMTEYRMVQAKMPNSADLLIKLGEVCKLKRDDNCALDYYRKAAAINEKDPGPKLKLALLYDGLGMRAQARPVYEQILKLEPDNWIALNNMAYILAEEGKDLDQALTMVQRAKQKMPNEPNVADTMGWIYIKKNLSDPAVQIYKELTSKDGSVSTWHYHLGMALYQRGDKAEAKKALAVALAKNPPKEEAGKIKELLAKIG
jgi:tetratricopeptide (TPR) repeat protein